MAETFENKPGRRDFLKSAAAVALVGGTCLGTGLKQAMAKAKKTGKPLLSEKSLNEFIESKPKAELRRLMEEAHGDVRAFIRKYFYVAPEQEKELAAVPEAELLRVSEGLQKALKENLKPQAKFVTAKSGPTPAGKIHAAAAANQTLHIGISVLGHEFLSITVEKPAKATTKP